MQTGKVVGKAKTVGQMKKVLDQLPDKMKIKDAFNEPGCQIMRWSDNGKPDYIEIMDLDE